MTTVSEADVEQDWLQQAASAWVECRYPGEGNHKGCPYVVFLNCYRLSHLAYHVPLFFRDGLNG